MSVAVHRGTYSGYLHAYTARSKTFEMYERTRRPNMRPAATIVPEAELLSPRSRRFQPPLPVDLDTTISHFIIRVTDGQDRVDESTG